MNRLFAIPLLLALTCGVASAAEPEPAPATAAQKTFDRDMQAVLTPYLAMHDAMARDTTDGVAEAAAALATAAGKLDPKTAAPAHAEKLADLPAKLAAGADAVRTANDLAGARAAFKSLSKPMGLWATLAGPAGIDVVYCSMTRGGWLQKTGPIRNPYHGSEMLACGQVVNGPGAKK